MPACCEYKLLLTGITQSKLEKNSNNQKFNNINKPPTHDDNNSNNVQTDDSHTDPTNSGSLQTPYSSTKVRPTEKAPTHSPKSGNPPKTEEPTEVYYDQPKSDCFKNEPFNTASRPTEYSQTNCERLKVGYPHNTDELTKKHQTNFGTLKQIHLQEPEDPTDTQTQKSSSSLDNIPSTDTSTGNRFLNNEGKTQIFLQYCQMK